MTAGESLLSPYRVLDLTDESGFLCGKILADLGADVIKIEPPGGDAARKLGPLVDADDASKSLYWLSYNLGKRGVTLDLEQAEGRRLFSELAASAHFIIESYPPGRLEELGLGFESLRSANPGLVLVSITPFGQSGPLSRCKGSDLVAMAMSGMMSLVGEAGQPPLRVSLPQSPLWTGMYAAAGALMAHYHRQTSGRGQQVDISLQSGLLWALANAPGFWATNRTSPVREGRNITGRSVTGATMQALYRCRDGYLNFILYGGTAGRRSNQALTEWIREAGVNAAGLAAIDWSSFDIQHTTQEEVDRIEAPIAEFFLSCTKAEFLEQAFRRDILGYPVATAKDILDDVHLREREFWHPLECPFSGRRVRIPGAFARCSDATIGPGDSAPRPGEHNQAIYSDELGRSDAELKELCRAGVI